MSEGTNFQLKKKKSHHINKNILFILFTAKTLTTSEYRSASFEIPELKPPPRPVSYLTMVSEELQELQEELRTEAFFFSPNNLLAFESKKNMCGEPKLACNTVSLSFSPNRADFRNYIISSVREFSRDYSFMG